MFERFDKDKRQLCRMEMKYSIESKRARSSLEVLILTAVDLSGASTTQLQPIVNAGALAKEAPTKELEVFCVVKRAFTYKQCQCTSLHRQKAARIKPDSGRRGV
jgi:hypothetical protein